MTEATVTLEEALKLLSLPRVVGLHPDDNEPIIDELGRFGPYVKHGDEFRSLESEEDVFTITFDAALALLAAPKGRAAAAGAPRRCCGARARDGSTLQAAPGRYGPVRDGRQTTRRCQGLDPDSADVDEARACSRHAVMRRPRREKAPAQGRRREAARAAAPRRRRAGGQRASRRSRKCRAPRRRATATLDS